MAAAIFKARYNGTCRKCNASVAPGEYISWSRRERGVVYHARCLGIDEPKDDAQAPQQTPQQTPQDQAHEQTPTQAHVDPAQIEAIAERVAQRLDAEMLGPMLKAVEERLDKNVPRTLTITVKEASPDAPVKIDIDSAHKSLKDLVYLASKGEHVYLSGPPGSGKSTGAVQAAKALGRRYGYVSLNPQTPESRLLGFIDAGGIYRETEFFRCYTAGGVFCIDELDNGHPALLNTLNGMLETDADGIGRGAFPCGVVERHADFVMIATGNTNGRGGDKLFPERRALDAAFLERFVFIHWGYDEALEKAMTMAANKDAREWLKWVRKVRHHVTQHSIRVWASPRASVKGAKLLKDSGWSHADIAERVLFKGLDKDTVSTILAACPLPADKATSTPGAVPTAELTE